MRTTSAARLAWDIQRPLRQQRCPGQARRAADGRSCRRSAVRMKPVTRIGKPRYLGTPRGGRPGQPEASASPTKTPQRRDTMPDPHRNPTDETAHPGTLVMRGKDTENSRSAAPMRVSWAVGGLFQVSALGMIDLLLSGSSTA